MQRLETCSSCQGFVDHTATVCPHCEATRAPRATASKSWIVKGIVAAVAGAGFAATLQACYGCPDASCGVQDSGPMDAGTDAGTE